MAIIDGSTASADDINNSIGSIVSDMIRADAAGDISLEKDYVNNINGSGSVNAGFEIVTFSSPLATYNDYSSFCGELYDDYDSSVDTTKWASDYTLSETTEYVKSTSTTNVCNLFFNTSTGLDLKQADGYSEIALKVVGGTYLSSGLATHNHRFWFTDGSTTSATNFFGYTNGTSSYTSTTYIFIRIDHSAETAYYYMSGSRTNSGSIDLSSLSNYYLKFEASVSSGSDDNSKVEIYDVVYSKASDISTMEYISNDLNPGESYDTAILYENLNDTELTLVNSFSADSSNYQTFTNESMNAITNTGTSAIFKMVPSSSDSDFLLKIGNQGVRYNLY